MTRMVARNAVDASRLRTIYRSDPFPTTAYGHGHNLAPALAQNIGRAFETFDWAGTALLREFEKNEPAAEAFMPITYRQHRSVLRQIEEATGVRYTCR